MQILERLNDYEDEIRRYTVCVKEIKTRINAIRKCAKNPGYFDNNSEVEFISLQLRCVLELITLSSLVAHAKYYNKTHEELGKIWRIANIMKQVEAINPDYFPVAVSIGEKEPYTISPLPDNGNLLTKNEFQDMHNYLCDFAHPQNPFAKRKDYTAAWNSFQGCAQKIGNLINVHLIQLVDVKVRFLVMVNLDNDRDPDIMFLTQH